MKLELLKISLAFAAFMFVLGIGLFVGIPYAVAGIFWLFQRPLGGYFAWAAFCLLLGLVSFVFVLPTSD